MRFEDEAGNWINFDQEFTTNHTGKYKKHGKWAKPVFPSNRSLQGSPQTPYIFDDRVRFEDVGNAIKEWWETSDIKRQEAGAAGREFCLTHGLTAKAMGESMIKHIDFLFTKPKEARPKYTFNKVESNEYKNIGITE
jgi:hypothetical protein